MARCTAAAAAAAAAPAGGAGGGAGEAPKALAPPRTCERGVAACSVAPCPGVPPLGASLTLPRRLAPCALPPPPLAMDTDSALMPTAALEAVGRLPTATV
jgi:hypothetical protein